MSQRSPFWSSRDSTGTSVPLEVMMRARTIGQIATLIAGHVGGAATTPAATPTPTPEPAAAAVEIEVDLDSLSTEQIDQLLGEEKPALEAISDV